MTTKPAGQLTDRAYRKVVHAWCMYDWANSAFAATMLASVLPAFYAAVPGNGLSNADGYWAYTNSAAMLLIAFSAPVLGAIADYTGARKSFLGVFAGIGVVLSALLAFVGYGDWLMASAIYVLARIGFGGANVFYDSLLPHVARSGELDRVSARGYAYGYLGGGILLAINVLMIKWMGEVPGARLSFVSVGIWWAVFSIPFFRGVQEPAISGIGSERRNPIRSGFKRLRKTFGEIRRYKELFKFLIAFWLYNDGLSTIMIVAAIFGRERMGLPASTLVAAILMIQFVGVPCAIGFGWLAKQIGPKRAIYIGLTVYALISLGALFMHSALHFWLLGIGVALVQGGTQAISRSLYGAMSPKAKASEFFGFFSVSAKFAGILGPAVYGLLSDLVRTGRLAEILGSALYGAIEKITDPSRLPAASLVLFFLAGAWLLKGVDVEEGIRIAEEENAKAEKKTEEGLEVCDT